MSSLLSCSRNLNMLGSHAHSVKYLSQHLNGTATRSVSVLSGMNQMKVNGQQQQQLANLQQDPPIRMVGQLSYQHQQIRYMSKYLTRSAKRRLPLTTKKARKGYYKGNQSTKEGSHTNKGKFVIDPMARLELVVPDLTDFKVCFNE